MYEHCQMNSAPSLLKKKKPQRNKHIFTSLQIWRLHFAFHLFPNYIVKTITTSNNLKFKRQIYSRKSDKMNKEKGPSCRYLPTEKSLTCCFKLFNWIFDSEMPQNFKPQVHLPKSHHLPYCVFRGCVIIPPREQMTFLCQIWGPIFSLVVPNTVLSPWFKNLPMWE